MAPHSSTLAWKIPWIEEPGGLQSIHTWQINRAWSTILSVSLSPCLDTMLIALWTCSYPLTACCWLCLIFSGVSTQSAWKVPSQELLALKLRKSWASPIRKIYLSNPRAGGLFPAVWVECGGWADHGGEGNPSVRGSLGQKSPPMLTPAGVLRYNFIKNHGGGGGKNWVIGIDACTPLILWVK